MEVEPSATARLDQALAAVRDIPQGLLLRFDGAILDILVEMNERGVPPSELHGLLHGMTAESIQRLAPKLEGSEQ